MKENQQEKGGVVGWAKPFIHNLTHYPQSHAHAHRRTDAPNNGDRWLRASNEPEDERGGEFVSTDATLTCRTNDHTYQRVASHFVPKSYCCTAAVEVLQQGVSIRRLESHPLVRRAASSYLACLSFALSRSPAPQTDNDEKKKQNPESADANAGGGDHGPVRATRRGRSVRRYRGELRNGARGGKDQRAAGAERVPTPGSGGDETDGGGYVELVVLAACGGRERRVAIAAEEYIP